MVAIVLMSKRLSPDEVYMGIWNFIKETNRMPTIRELAEYLGISNMTAHRKIKTLKEEGRIVTKPKSHIAFPPPEAMRKAMKAHAETSKNSQDNPLGESG